MREKISRFFRSVYKLFVSHPFTMLFCLLAYSYIVVFLIVLIFEEVGFIKAATLIMPAFLGELGEVESKCFITKFGILAALLISVAFLAVVTAKITTVFIDFCLKGGSIMKKVNMSDHIIICGWNFQGERILKNLLNSGSIPRRDIVVLANLSQRPTKNEQMDYVKGDPTQDEALIRAGVEKANSVLVLTDLTKEANEADAEALMIVLAVESLNRSVHTCVQIVNSSNRRHMERAHADEIICLDLMGGNLLTASAVNHGVSLVITELLTFNSGSEFYRYDGQLSEKVVGKEFFEVVQMLIKQRSILIGFETDNSEELRERMATDVLHVVDNGKRLIVANPQNPYKIRQGDALFLIAESEPIAI